MLWAGDTRKRLLANVTAYNGDVALVTITGPGADVIPWGDDGFANRTAATRWNRTAPGRWRALHRAASQRARRRHGRFSMVGRTWEYQRRGVLHVHVVIGINSARELAAAHVYVQALDELRQAHGFGWVDRGRKRAGKRLLEVIPAQTAARYVAKYLSPLDRAGKPTISETVRREDVPANVVYISRALTAKTGVTMRSLRRVRIAHFLGFDPSTGETYSSIVMREYLRLAAAGVQPHGP